MAFCCVGVCVCVCVLRYAAGGWLLYRWGSVSGAGMSGCAWHSVALKPKPLPAIFYCKVAVMAEYLLARLNVSERIHISVAPILCFAVNRMLLWILLVAA